MHELVIVCSISIRGGYRMIATSITLLNRTLQSDSIGVQEEVVTETEVPLLRVEDIYSNEFYEAEAQGHKPELRLRLSDLNYNGEPELIYRGITYTVVRTQNPVLDEIVLVCERKIKNG